MDFLAPPQVTHTDHEDHWIHALTRGDVLRLPKILEQPFQTPPSGAWLFLDYHVHQSRECLELVPAASCGPCAGRDCIAVRSTGDLARAGLSAPVRFDLAQRHLVSFADDMLARLDRTRSPIIGRLSRTRIDQMNEIRAKHRAQRDMASGGFPLDLSDIDDWFEAPSARA
jgi:hypothetical protein